MFKGVIYKHISPNGKVYIGQTTSPNPKLRWSGKNPYSQNSYFSNSISKYGWENFKHEIIHEVEAASKEELFEILNDLEEKYIIEYNSMYPNGFNLRPGGHNSPLTEATKEKLREINKGKKLSDETKKKISEASKKQVWTAERKLNISKASKGRKFSEDFKEKCRKAKLGNTNALGHTLTEESKQKIKLTKLKNGTNKWSEEYRQKRKENPRHWKLSDETKRKISESRKGIKFSDEHKKKLSEWQKGRPKPSSKYKKTPEHIAKIRESRIKSGKIEPGNKGKICINDGRKIKYIGINESIPDGWVKGNISYLWFNDGIYSYRVNPLDEYKYIDKFIKGKNKLPRKIEAPDMEEAESVENNAE